jgi:hypothetical protein
MSDYRCNCPKMGKFSCPVHPKPGGAEQAASLRWSCDQLDRANRRTYARQLNGLALPQRDEIDHRDDVPALWPDGGDDAET